jgi:hypothetical protein
MKKTKILFVLLFLWIGLLPLAAQSVRITQELTLHPFATVLPMYKNEFGSFEKPALDITFPYSVIRMNLEGNAHDVRAAKERLTLFMGQMTGVEARCTTYSNQILFLVPARRPSILIDCGDGCDRVLLIERQKLEPNRVYDCSVHFIPEREGNVITDTVFVNQGPKYHTLNLHVEPADAKVEIVMLNGIKQKCSVVDGMAELKLEEGEYRYTISAEHYYPQEGVLSVPTTSTDVVLSLNPKVGWLSITSDSTDLTDLSVEVLRMVEPAKGKKMTKKEVKQNTSTHSLPLQPLLCDTGIYQLHIEKKKYFDYNRTISINEGDNIVLSPKMRPHIINTFIIAEAGVALNPEWGVGLMFGQMYDGVGWYVKGRSNWNIPKKDQYGGKLFNTTKETTSLEWIVDAGMVVDFLMKKEKKDKDNFIGLYVGAGYGSRERYWYNTAVKEWGKYYPNSYHGVSVNIGVIGSIQGMTLMAGMNTLAFKYTEIEIGLGYTF